MLIHQKTGYLSLPEPHDVDLMRLTSAGRQIAKGLVIGRPSKAAASTVRHSARDAERGIKNAFKSANSQDANGKWLLENYRLILTAQKETRPLPPSCREYRTATVEGSSKSLPLPYFVAQAYLGAGFLQSAKLIQVPASLALIGVFPALCLVYGVTKIVVARRYL